MDRIFSTFRDAQLQHNGYELETTFAIESLVDLREFAFSTNVQRVESDIKQEILYGNSQGPRLSHASIEVWTEVYTCHWRLARALTQGDEENWVYAVKESNSLLSSVMKGYESGDKKPNWEIWTLPVLYTTARNSRWLAIKADLYEKTHISDKNQRKNHLEEFARLGNRVFTLCINDRAELERSRKWGVYYIMNLLFKTYFKLGSTNLAKNLIRSVSQPNIQLRALQDYPKSHRVTYLYYSGVVQFLEENYIAAEEALSDAFGLCDKHHARNVERILTYLIPCRLFTAHQLPSPLLLAQFPRLGDLFSALRAAVRSASLSAFDSALATGEAVFVAKRIYLTLERARHLVLRNLFHKVWLAMGRESRIAIEAFRVGLGLSQGADVESREVECLLANLIAKGFMKGYISYERQTVVLSKSTPFPRVGGTM